MNQQPLPKKHQIQLILLLLAAFMVFGCSMGTPLTLQQKVRMFFYENQTDAGPMFVDWADENLGDYSSRSIQDALAEEGKYHADLGHPNAIAVISQASRDWAAKHNLRYKERDWRSLQEQAFANMRPNPGELQIWPK